MSQKVLITGGLGQISKSLMHNLASQYGKDNVLVTDLPEQGPSGFQYTKLDITDQKALNKTFNEFKPTQVYHLAALLSAHCEANPQAAKQINIDCYSHILDLCGEFQSKIFWPSSIASYGSSTPKIPGQLEIMRPSTLYGIAKVYGELMGEYYHKKYNLDFRSLRVPIVTSSSMQSAGGSAAFTVTMFKDLKKNKKVAIPIEPDAFMPIIHLPDLINNILLFMNADSNELRFRTYTPLSIGVSVGDYCNQVMQKFQDCQLEYAPDFRSDIVKSWPNGTNGKEAEEDWGCKLDYGLKEIVEDIFNNIKI